MKKPLYKDSPFLFLFFAILLLPLAQAKVIFFGLPLYLPEIAIFLALVASLIRYRGSSNFNRDNFPYPDGIFLSGAILFFSGAILSLLMNHFFFHDFGMLKSWFFFPLLAGMMVFLEAREERKRLAFLYAWFAALAVTALSSLIFFAQGIMTYDGRLSGMYPSPNFLAIFIAPGILISLYLLSFPKENKRSDVFKRVSLLVGGVAIVLALFFTHSYGVWVACMIAFLVFFLGRIFLFGIRRSDKIIFLTFLLCVGTFLSLELGSEKWQAFSSFQNRSSLASRAMIWQAATRILSDHPIFGIGPGRFQETYLEYQRYFPPYLEWAVPEPHNLYLAVYLSTGALGFFGFFLFVSRFVFLSVRSFFSKMDKNERFSVLFFLAILIIFLVYGMADTPYFKNDLALAFFLPFFLGLPNILKKQPL